MINIPRKWRIERTKENADAINNSPLLKPFKWTRESLWVIGDCDRPTNEKHSPYFITLGAFQYTNGYDTITLETFLAYYADISIPQTDSILFPVY